MIYFNLFYLLFIMFPDLSLDFFHSINHLHKIYIVHNKMSSTDVPYMYVPAVEYFESDVWA